ncbi:uncharacterized protein LOC105198485 isoform X4 [Solenopsis invicta]|uniref:uncharacterized protein LOC105198485 isoform X4 n=1 Tax=Solenopsis invicta TaxID=13686 RepID=UPI00193E7374|nr:uncharacterized protein LOC105198485 isoform X4 [Solenopsis invicta]
MSKQIRVLELNNCISSRLWYTSLNIFNTSNDSKFLKEFHYNCCVDLTELKTVIESLRYSPNEEQYQWIAYVLLWKLINSKSSSVDCDIQCNIQAQFDCIQMKSAIELCGNIPDCLYKELLEFFQGTSTESSAKYTSSIIFQRILTLLKDNIFIDTEIVCWIINKLSVVLNEHDIISYLQNIYFSTLKLCLDRIPAGRSWYSNYATNNSPSEIDSAICDNFLRTALQLLSKINIDANAEIEFLKTVCPTLSKSHYIKDIELALYSRKNEKLLYEWVSLWDKTHACFESATSLLMAYKISEGIFKLTEDSEIFLCKWELLKRTSVRKSHWLNDILDICYILTTKGKYSEVELLLSCDLLKRLYPVLLFKALSECPQEIFNTSESYNNGIAICESIDFLLEKCYLDLCNDYDLNGLYTLLKNHIRIVVYILQWKKRHLTNVKLDTKESKNLQFDAIEQIASVKQILSLLQKHNVLFVLKFTTNIHDQDHGDIQDLLEETTPTQSASFQAYCCTISALKAIFLCESYNTEYRQITKYFTRMVSHLSSLFPLSLRIETIESIFSLLFLRYDDLNVTNPNSKDNDCNTHSSMEYERSGFIANNYAVRDMLYYLWKSTSITKEEIDELYEVPECEETQRLRENVSTLTLALTDTRWRLKFYLGPHFVEDVGAPSDEFDNSSVINKLEFSVFQKPSINRAILHRKGDTFFYKGDNTSDETKVKSDSSSESSLLGGSKRRKHSRHTAAASDYNSTRNRLSLISLMLASRESLILHCLWKGDFQKAREVIEMFHMENTQLDGEIRFSEALYKFKRNICKHVHILDAANSSKEGSTTSTLEVYEAQTLNDALDDAARDYIAYYSAISPDNKLVGLRQKIDLPDLVKRYQDTFSRNIDVGVTNTNRSLPPIVGFEEFNENVDVEYTTPSYTYEVILKYSKHSVSSVATANVAQTSVWQTQTLRSSLLQYLERHCWFLSYLVQRMHNENPTILENNFDNLERIACLENLLNSPWVDKLKVLYNNNRTLAAVHDSMPLHELWHYFELKIDHSWHISLEILNALDDSVVKCNTELQRFKDLILSHTLSNLGVLSITRMLQYLYQINDIHVLAQTILHNISKWPMILCEHALSHALQHDHSHKLPTHCRHRMNGVLCRIMIFHKMIPYCMSRSNSTWYDIVYCTEKINPFEIMKSLIDAEQYKLCLEWLECQAFSLEMQTPVIQDILTGLLKNEQQGFKQALKFLQALPLSQSLKICKGVLKQLESTSALQFIADYLLEHCKTAERPKYRKTLVGLEILKILENKDRALYVHLIKEPLLMLEQLLMNCKFENIQMILNALQENLEHPDIGFNNFDKVIRFYAKKSLDFRVSLQRDGIENKAKNISQSNLEVENNEFVMPVNVPTKEEWIPNDRAKECGCCKTVIFSMFNRRHHCRRCGRVVCAVCSQHRMQVAGYPSSVLVRVCDDCKRQTVLQIRAAQNIPSTSSSELFDYWRLTKDERHNHTIREEFSFEHAPNISLCLAILNLHFDPKIYTSFLLDRCDEMKQLLQPVNGRINPEVDYAVIIKMIRSLLVAAKMKCAKFGFNTGLAHCDRFLSQVDLLATLVHSDCVALIPTDDLDEHTLRKLRDLLTEKERWTLALDVSTKAGLDTQGVWAAWGKACLKVGYLDQAKEKFHHCLDKIVHEDIDDWVVLSCPKESPVENSREESMETMEKKACKGSYLKRSEYSKCRPLKDPPLLTEILQILDILSIHRSRTQHPNPQPKSDAAQEILQTLNSLKAVSQNQFNVKYLMPANQTIYYQESLYYLLAYGSYTSLLQFFLRYKEFDKCVAYILDNDIERDLFLNGVYLYCLRNGYVEKLHDAMKARDPTLVVWRKYLISVCLFMERKQYWHILYQIQLFMRDCVRASMTCIRFYTDEANTYSDLHNRAHLLQDAQKHLESELQLESFTKRRKNSVLGDHSGQNTVAMEMEPSEIDRHINTICRQTEIVKFLANSEKEGRASAEFLNLFPDIDSDNSQTLQLPTLFGNQQQKIHLAVLAILCGRDIGEGFGIAFRIMQDYNLPQQKVYSLAGHVLALRNDVAAIEQLIKCCRSSGTPSAHVISDHVLAHCVKLLLTHSYSEQNPTLKNHIDTLVRLIIDTELRINAYIESKQLKAAYLLAVKHSRAQDIRKIFKESDRLGQSAIKAICLKWLQQEPKDS